MKNLFIELADTDSKRELGLMNRKSLSKDQGMLFKFPYSTRLSFWMKNTYIPLDIAFLDGDGRILQIESMIPLSTRPIVSNTHCKYALEVNKGWFKDNDIKVGNIIGGRGIKKKEHRTAQITTPDLGMPTNQPNQPNENPNIGGGDMGNPPAPAPDVTLNMSMKEKLDAANLKGKDLMILYTTKYGRQLGPKLISPPFLFEPNEEGQHDKVVKAWDNQDAGWKSFLIDNIQSLEEKQEIEKEIQEPTKKDMLRL